MTPLPPSKACISDSNNTLILCFPTTSESHFNMFVFIAAAFSETAVRGSPMLLPEKSPSSDVVVEYLFSRGIDYEIINYCLDNDLIMESLPYHNVVFIGYDEERKPKYAAYRATNQSRLMGDCTGSKKQYSFRLQN